MKRVDPQVFKGITIAAGVILIVFSVFILGLGLWESIGSVKQNVQIMPIPGFQHMKFASAGPYVGLYQHTGKGAVPIKILSGMEYRLISQDGTRELPVTTNKNGDIITRFGQEAVMAMSFVVDEAGDYTMSAFYLGTEKEVPEMSLTLFGQGAQGLKQTIVIAGIFSVLFLVLGIYILVWSRKIGVAPLGVQSPKPSPKKTV